jgi:hypothetical protein
VVGSVGFTEVSDVVGDEDASSSPQAAAARMRLATASDRSGIRRIIGGFLLRA